MGGGGSCHDADVLLRCGFRGFQEDWQEKFGEVEVPYIEDEKRALSMGIS